MDNGQWTKRKMSNGFTLVEILVVIAVLSVVGVIITTIFVRNLRGSNKSQIISSIKQNGQIVLENMDKTIRNSDNIVCISNNTSRTVYTMVVEKGGLYTRYRITPPNDPTVPSACLANGCIAQDDPTKQINQATGKEETDPEFIMRVCIANDLMQSANILTDTNSQTGVKVLSGAFSEADKEKSSGFKKAVKISFVLGPGSEAPKAVAGQIDPVTFETTVQLR